MTDLSPFRAIRTDAALPDDAITPERFSAWRREGRLAIEREPAIYVLAQTFHGSDGAEQARTCFFARARLARHEQDFILPKAPAPGEAKAAALEQLRATRTSLAPVLCLFDDDNAAVGTLLRELTKTKPAIDATSPDGTRNRLWPIADPSVNDRLRRIFVDKKLSVVGAEERYEAALAYRDERREEAFRANATISDRGSGPGYEHVFVFCAAAGSNLDHSSEPKVPTGLVVYPLD